MKQKIKNALPYLALALLAGCYVALTLLHPVAQDEGVFLTIGQNMDKGLVPYQDFFDHKPPGIYFLFSFLYRFLDNHIVWYKIVLIITNLISAWLVYRIAMGLSSITKSPPSAGSRHQAGQIPNSKFQNINKTVIPVKTGIQDKSSGSQIKSGMTNSRINETIDQLNYYLWAPVFFLWLILVFEGQYLIAEPFVAFFLLLGLYLCLRQIRPNNLLAPRSDDSVARLEDSIRTRTKWGHSDRSARFAESGGIPFRINLILSGLMFGFALLFKQTAVLSIIAFIIYLIWQKQLKQLALFLLGVAVPIIATISYLWQNNILTDAYRQIILYNFQYYPSENIFKVISLLVVPFLYTLPVWLLFVYYIANRLPRLSLRSMARDDKIKSDSSFVIWPIGYPFVGITLLALLPMLGYFGRHYPHYWLQSAPFVAILAANALNDAVGKFRTNLIAPSLSPEADLAGHCLIFGSKSGNKESYFFQHRAQALACFIVISASIFSYNFLRINYPKYRAEQQLVQFLRQKDASIYSENQFIGAYFLTQKTPLSRHLYITEITDWSEQSEQRTIEQAKKNQTLIIWPTDSNYAYAKELQRYIFANYKPIFWQYDLGVVVYKTQMGNTPINVK